MVDKARKISKGSALQKCPLMKKKAQQCGTGKGRELPGKSSWIERSVDCELRVSNGTLLPTSALVHCY